MLWIETSVEDDIYGCYIRIGLGCGSQPYTGIGEGNVGDRELIQNCKELLSWAWVIKVKHIFREANRAADWIAKWTIKRGIGMYKLVWPP